MDFHIGIVKVTPTFFFVVKSFISFITPFLFHWMFKLVQQRVELVRIGVGMVCAISCCITAWRVEVNRLNKLKHNISMSGFWLLPQFSLLGLMEGLADKGLEEFICKHSNEPMKRTASLVSKLVIGFGNFISIPCVILVKTWFKDNINASHLDRYFLTLAILGFVFLCIFAYVSPTYPHMDAPLEDVEPAKDGFDMEPAKDGFDVQPTEQEMGVQPTVEVMKDVEPAEVLNDGATLTSV